MFQAPSLHLLSPRSVETSHPSTILSDISLSPASPVLSPVKIIICSIQSHAHLSLIPLPSPFPSTLPCLSSWKPPNTSTKPGAIPEKRDSSEIKQEEDEEIKEGESLDSTPTTPHEEASKKEAGEDEVEDARRIILRLLGLGPRLYAVAGLINVPVYALSLYAEPTQAQARLLSTLPPAFDFFSPPPLSYYTTLLSSSSSSSSSDSWPRALYLTFCRSVGTKRVLEAFEPYPRLAAAVLPSIEASFEEAFGGAGIQAGDLVGFVWLEGEGLLTVVRLCLVSRLPCLPQLFIFSVCLFVYVCFVVAGLLIFRPSFPLL